MKPTKTDLAAVRARITELQSQIKELDALPPSRDETRANVLHHLQRLTADYARSLTYRLGQVGVGEHDPLLTAPTGIGKTLDITTVIAAVLGPERLLELLEPYLSTLPEGVPAAQRAADREELEDALLAAGHAEQDLLDAAMVRGETVIYRADADPCCVLRITTPTT
jgi:hypothetical protein